MSQELLLKEIGSETDSKAVPSSVRSGLGLLVSGGKRLMMVAVLALPLAVVSYLPSAQAQEEENASEMARQGIDALMKALKLFIDDIPQYAAPEVNERGDIIIRRLNPDSEGSETEKSPSEEDTKDT
ncbi:hypothetical protein ACTL6U_15205 [Rhodovibrionaceae bacterium A322]